eukprot:5948239-Amphidinium_carterae.1
MVAEIVLREHLGYTVVNVFHLNLVSGMNLQADMMSGLTDVEMENWSDRVQRTGGAVRHKGSITAE